jgi:hypothetical protein
MNSQSMLTMDWQRENHGEKQVHVASAVESRAFKYTHVQQSYKQTMPQRDGEEMGWGWEVIGPKPPPPKPPL